MENLKKIVIILLLIAQKSIGEKLSIKSDYEDIISKNVIFIYSNSTLLKKFPKNVGTIVTPHIDTELYIVYPETTIVYPETTIVYPETTIITTTEKPTPEFLTRTNSDLIVHYTRDYNSEFEITYTTENMSTMKDIEDEIVTRLITEETPLKYHYGTPLKSSVIGVSIPFTENSIEATTMFENNTDSTNETYIDYTLSTYDFQTTTPPINIEKKEYKENEIETQSSENHITSLIPTKVKMKMKKHLNLKKKDATKTLEELFIKTSLPSILTSSESSYKKSHFIKSNGTTAYKNEIKKSETVNSINIRDSLLRQSIKSKKFISALMKRSKNRVSSTISNKSNLEDSTTVTTTVINKAISPTRRIYTPRKASISTKKNLSSHTTISTLKDSITLFPDEISDQYLATEWRSMKINKAKNQSMRSPYRGRKRFSLIDVVRVNT